MTHSQARQAAETHDATHRHEPEALAPDVLDEFVPGNVQRLAMRPNGRPARALNPRLVTGLQRLAGNAAVARLAVAPALALQRAVYKEGGKGAVEVPANAKSIKAWVTKPSVQPGGRNHIADIQGRGFPGFKKGKEEFAGGRTFNNGAQPDKSKLPYLAGQTYQEWDINPCVAGQNRGADRILTSSDGKAYYTNDHYNNFTEF